MLRLIVQIILILAISHLLVSNSLAQCISTPNEKHIYYIKIIKKGEILVQTGFKLKGYEGIITALHGILGSDEIRAWSKCKTHNDLVLSKVDIERDVAFLTNEELVKSRNVGFEVKEYKENYLLPRQSLFVWGHPGGIQLRGEPVSTNQEVFKKLETIMPMDIVDVNALVVHDSPSLQVDIVDLEDASLEPGHSGAPLLDSNNRVVGIINGGIERGDRAWAMPIYSLEWQSESSASRRLNQLSNLKNENPFFSTKIAPTPNFPRDKEIKFSYGINRSADSMTDPYSTVQFYSLIFDSHTRYGTVGLGLEMGIISNPNEFSHTYYTLPGLSPITTKKNVDTAIFMISGRYLPFSIFKIGLSPYLGFGFGTGGSSISYKTNLGLELAIYKSIFIRFEGKYLYYNVGFNKAEFNRYGYPDYSSKVEGIGKIRVGFSIGFQIWNNKKSLFNINR